MSTSTIAIVVAMGKNRELGKDGKLLWHIPDDLKRFRTLTSNHPVILGRKTFESIVGYVGGPLPKRANIIVTRDKAYDVSKFNGDITITHSLEEAIEIAKQKPGAEEIHIGGGADLYRQVLPQVRKLYLTLIDAEAPEADAFFPPYEQEFTKKVFDEEREWEGLKYRWVDLERTVA